MKTRNTNTFRATLSDLRTEAFGKPIVLPWVANIEIYQARVSPELWRARPRSGRTGHLWEASSAVDLMIRITGEFVAVVKPWTEWTRYDVLVGPAKLPAGVYEEVKRAG